MASRTKNVKRGMGLRAALIGAGAGIITAIVLCVVLSVLISKEKLPEDMMKHLLTAVCFVSGMVAAISGGKARGARLLPIGIAAAGLMSAAALLAGIAAGRQELINRGVLTLLLAILGGGIIGGVISSAGERKKK